MPEFIACVCVCVCARSNVLAGAKDSVIVQVSVAQKLCRSYPRLLKPVGCAFLTAFNKKK